MIRSGLVAAAAALLLGGCDRSADGAAVRAETTARAQTFAQRLTDARGVAPGAGENRPVARWELPSLLAEISGLALTPDGRLLAHGDEGSDVFEIDYRTGLIVKRFALGPDPVTEDFEAIAVHDSVVMLFTSKGRIFQFTEGENGESVPYRTHTLEVDDACREFEGAAYDAQTGRVVLVCKTPRGKLDNDAVLIYRVAVDSAGGFERVDVPVDSIRARGPKWKGFSPSDIAIRPDNGNYLLVAGPEKGYAEVTPQGAVLLARALPQRHPQTEGIAVSRDGLLILADEAVSRRATLTVYAGPFR